MALRALVAFALTVAAATTQKTSVVLFTPWESGQIRHGYSVASKAKGSCWTNALTTNRPDAWRCMIGNDIYDPCFAGAAHATVVACADDPFSKRVVLLNLTKPLANGDTAMSQMLQPKGEPWGLRLTNGETCSFATGATDVVQGMRMNYECKGNDFIAGLADRSKPLWSAHLIVWPNKSRLKTVEIATAVF
jgi:hypothetical protein